MPFVTIGTFTSGQVLTAAQMNDIGNDVNIGPRGYVAHATRTTNTSYTLTPADVITGVTATLVSGRRYRVTAHVNFHALAANFSRLRVYQDATVIGQGFAFCQNGVNEQATVTVVIYLTGSGSSTFKTDIAATSGNSSGTAVASATQPGLLLIEDIGST
jgi:hypothetical protein